MTSALALGTGGGVLAEVFLTPLAAGMVFVAGDPRGDRLGGDCLGESAG